MTDFGILLASPHNPIGCINWFEHPRVYGRISFTGDCTPHTKLYSQVTQTTFFGHDLFANLSAAWHLGQLLALYSRLAPAITNAWCCQKKSSRILETKFLAFPLALTLASFQGWFGVGSNMSKFFKAYCLIIIIMYDGFTIESVPFFLECQLLSKPSQLDADRQSDYAIYRFIATELGTQLPFHPLQDKFCDSYPWRDRVGQSWDWNSSSWHQWPHVVSAALRLESRWPWLQAWRSLTTTLLSMDQHGSEHCPVAWDYAT